MRCPPVKSPRGREKKAVVCVCQNSPSDVLAAENTDVLILRMSVTFFYPLVSQTLLRAPFEGKRGGAEEGGGIPVTRPVVWAGLARQPACPKMVIFGPSRLQLENFLPYLSFLCFESAPVSGFCNYVIARLSCCCSCCYREEGGFKGGGGRRGTRR